MEIGYVRTNGKLFPTKYMTYFWVVGGWGKRDRDGKGTHNEALHI